MKHDLELHKESILGMGMYAIERSYPKVGIDQIWKQYLKQLKKYAHIWKLKHCAKADADADMPTPTPGWQHKLSRDIVPAN